MSSGPVWFSSPLRPKPVIGHDHFRTPQQLKSAWNTTFTPPVKSPLRTSINANLMSGFPTDCRKADIKDANSHLLQENAIPIIPFGINSSVQATPPTAISKPSISSKSSTSSASATTSQSSRATSFQFQARARSSSPSIQLQNHTTSGRDSRKKLFLDRLRSKRDDERFERSGEQVMRMDWVREQKARESDLARRSIAETGMHLDLEADGMSEEPLIEGEMSPTEEREIEDLVSHLESIQQSSEPQEDDFSDEDYDALFTAVINQEVSGKEVSHDTIEQRLSHRMALQHEIDMDLS